MIRNRIWQTDPVQDENEDSKLQGCEKKTLHITLTMHETNEKNGNKKEEDVMYNQDENRFTQTCTLNLKTFSHYIIAVDVHEDEKLEHVTLGRKTYFNMVQQQPGKEFFYVTENPDKQTRSFAFVYSTDKIRATDRHHRTVLPCSMKLEGFGELKFNLLVNFCHSNKKDHLAGVTLKVINIDATLSNESTLDSISYG